MYLFDFEFKRNLKNYINIISMFCFAFIIEVVNHLINYNEIAGKALRGKDSNVLTNTIGTMSFSNIISSDDKVLFMMGLLACILYSVIIWKKDFNGKNKSIYTLVMLPQDKMKIYLSKFLNIICLVYMYIISFTLTLFLCYIIMPSFMKGDVVKLSFIKETIYTFGMVLPYSIETFITGYVFLLGAVISFIFTINIGKNFKFNILKTIAVLIICFIGYEGYHLFRYSIYTYEISSSLSSFLGAKNLSLSICIISSMIMIMSYFISKKRLNKLDY